MPDDPLSQLYGSKEQAAPQDAFTALYGQTNDKTKPAKTDERQIVPEAVSKKPLPDTLANDVYTLWATHHNTPQQYAAAGVAGAPYGSMLTPEGSWATLSSLLTHNENLPQTAGGAAGALASNLIPGGSTAAAIGRGLLPAAGSLIGAQAAGQDVDPKWMALQAVVGALTGLKQPTPSTPKTIPSINTNSLLWRALEHAPYLGQVLKISKPYLQAAANPASTATKIPIPAIRGSSVANNPNPAGFLENMNPQQVRDWLAQNPNANPIFTKTARRLIGLPDL